MFTPERVSRRGRACSRKGAFVQGVFVEGVFVALSWMMVCREPLGPCLAYHRFRLYYSTGITDIREVDSSCEKPIRVCVFVVVVSFSFFSVYQSSCAPAETYFWCPCPNTLLITTARRRVVMAIPSFPRRSSVKAGLKYTLFRTNQLAQFAPFALHKTLGAFGPSVSKQIHSELWKTGGPRHKKTLDIFFTAHLSDLSG